MLKGKITSSAILFQADKIIWNLTFLSLGSYRMKLLKELGLKFVLLPSVFLPFLCFSICNTGLSVSQLKALRYYLKPFKDSLKSMILTVHKDVHFFSLNKYDFQAWRVQKR